MSKKPPLGLTPKSIAMRERYLAVCSAIQRYWDAGREIPIEWIEEYNELVVQYHDPVLDSPQFHEPT